MTTKYQAWAGHYDARTGYGGDAPALSAAEHHRQAEIALHEAENSPYSDGPGQAFYLQVALIHATLACATGVAE